MCASEEAFMRVRVTCVRLLATAALLAAGLAGCQTTGATDTTGSSAAPRHRAAMPNGAMMRSA